MHACWEFGGKKKKKKIWETQTTRRGNHLKYPYGSLEFLLGRRITMRSRQTLIDFTANTIHEWWIDQRMSITSTKKTVANENMGRNESRYLLVNMKNSDVQLVEFQMILLYRRIPFDRIENPVRYNLNLLLLPCLPCSDRRIISFVHRNREIMTKFKISQWRTFHFVLQSGTHLPHSDFQENERRGKKKKKT